MPTATSVRVHASRLSIPVGQVALAGSGYLVLVAAGRTLPAGGFAAVSAFYMLTNTLARGLFQAVELELTRAIASARSLGDPGWRAMLAVLRRALGLLVAAVVLLGAATPFLLTVLDDDSASLGMLFLATASVATSHVLRGPLAALGRYHAFAGTSAVEAACCLVGAAVLFLAGAQHPAAWCSVFALAPAVATLVVTSVVAGAPARRGMAAAWRAGSVETWSTTSVNTSGLLWSAVIFLASQAVWNLGAVVVTARSGVPEVAAGFAAISVLLRAPVLVFPAIQALVLPAVTAEAARGARGLLAQTLRRRVVPIAAMVVLWMVGACVLAPVATRLVFGLPVVPGAVVVEALATSAVLGAAAALLQTQLVARGRHRSVALAWLAGLIVLLAVSVSPVGAVDVLGGAGQLSATVVVLVALLVTLARGHPATGAARHLEGRATLNPT